MSHISIPPNAFGFPMPVSVVGTTDNGKPNFMAAAWVSRVNMTPPMIAIALGHHHLSTRLIRENGEFGISFPPEKLLVETDYVGLISGEKASKSEVFPSFFGQLAKAPLLRDAPMAMECRLVQTVELPFNTLFVAEIVAAHAQEEVLTGGKVDLAKSRPLMLSMPDNRYWSIGEPIGKAWSDGRAYRA